MYKKLVVMFVVATIVISSITGVYAADYIENDFHGDISVENFNTVKAELAEISNKGELGYQIFSDVTPDLDCYEAVQAFGQLGIISGVGNGKFSPDTPITLTQYGIVIFNILDPIGFSQEIEENGIEEALLNECDKTGLRDLITSLMMDGYRAWMHPKRFSNLTLQMAGIRMFDESLYDTNTELTKPAVDLLVDLGIVDNTTWYMTRGQAIKAIYDVLLADIDVEEPEMMNRVNFSYESDFYDVNSVLLSLKNVPDVIIDKFNERGWKLIAGDDRLNEYFDDTGIVATGLCDHSECTLYVGSHYSLVHEFGHFLKQVLIHPFEISTLYGLEADKLATLKGSYCKTNSSEYFAEAFSLYIDCLNNPNRMERFKNIAPLTWEYFNNLHSNNWEIVSW